MLILAFTTIPPRFSKLGGFIASLEAQSEKPDRVELYLPPSYRRFPGARPTLPTLPEWVEVIETPEDLGPATKILPATQRWRGRDVDLLYCDDDLHYDPGWVARMRAARRRLPGMAICERGALVSEVSQFPSTVVEPRAVRDMATLAELVKALDDPLYQPPLPDYQKVFTTEGHVDIMEGVGGVLTRPDMFHEDVYHKPDVIWAVDDIWLSGMATLKGTPIWALASALPPMVLGATARTEPLFEHEELGMRRAQLNTLAVAWFRETYGIWV